MNSVLLALFAWLPLADVAPIGVYGPVIFFLVVPILLVVVGIVLYNILKNRKR